MDCQTLAVPHVRRAVIRNQGAGDDILLTKDVSLKTYEVVLATAEFDCALQGLAAWTIQAQIELRQPDFLRC